MFIKNMVFKDASISYWFLYNVHHRIKEKIFPKVIHNIAHIHRASVKLVCFYQINDIARFYQTEAKGISIPKIVFYSVQHSSIWYFH